jgi:DNA invertase Pin-like site-specific DNA recombinase
LDFLPFDWYAGRGQVISTDDQDLRRQEAIQETARLQGYYIAGVYREKASGARADRPELLRMIADLQAGEVVIAEKMDRISRLPLVEAEKLILAIQSKGARLAVPGVVDLTELAAESDGVAKIVLKSVQAMLLRLALQIARDDYEARRERQRQGVQIARLEGKYKGRKADASMHQRIEGYPQHCRDCKAGRMQRKPSKARDCATKKPI